MTLPPAFHLIFIFDLRNHFLIVVMFLSSAKPHFELGLAGPASGSWLEGDESRSLTSHHGPLLLDPLPAPKFDGKNFVPSNQRKWDDIGFPRVLCNMVIKPIAGMASPRQSRQRTRDLYQVGLETRTWMLDP